MRNKPICFKAERVLPEIYSGTPSFMGLPVIAGEEEISGYDVVIMGAPWEGVVTWGGYSGCELAPKAIRNASARYGGFLPEMGFDVFDYLSGGDFGDAATFPGNPEKTLSALHDRAAAVFRAGAIPVTFGGDHSVSVPLVQALAESVSGKIGVIHLDSHMDNMDSYGGRLDARCCPLHRIYELDGVDPRNIVHMGMRGPRNNPVQMDAALSRGATILTAFDVKLGGWTRPSSGRWRWPTMVPMRFM